MTGIYHVIMEFKAGRMQEIERYIETLVTGFHVGYFQLSDIAANCFISSDYDKPTTFIRRDTTVTECY